VNSTVSSNKSTVKYFRSPKNLIRRFVAKRTARSAIILGLIVAIYTLSKASSFVTAYPTEAARQKLAESLGSNVGVEALLGVAHHLDTVAGYAAWNFLCLIAAGGAVWALLLATKTFRGEEDNGRWELLLSGQTTARRAAINTLVGLSCGLVIIYIFFSLAILGIGHLHGANFTLSASLFFALALSAGAAEFLAVGALASQLMPVRSRASGLAAALFGLFYLIRLVADTTNAHWLLNVSPLGWIERLQPMYNSQPLWLLPIAIFIVILCGLTIFLASRRDLGDSTFADRETTKMSGGLLKTPLQFGIRLTRTTSLAWLFAVGITGLLYGLLAKGAAQSLGQSSSAENAISRLDQVSKTAIVTEFMGIVFFLMMILVMFYAASAVGRIREDEAEGYLDNFLVRPVSRLQWLGGRAFLILIVVGLAGLLGSLATWIGETSQHGGISLHSILLAGANAMTPVVLILGIGILAFGIVPRFTSLASYAAIAWSFLIVMLSSGLNLNHWLLDTSILHQVALAPAVSANWTTDSIMILLALVLGSLGSLRFNSRDIQGE